jgi:hypothetical protein
VLDLPTELPLYQNGRINLSNIKLDIRFLRLKPSVNRLQSPKKSKQPTPEIHLKELPLQMIILLLVNPGLFFKNLISLQKKLRRIDFPQQIFVSSHDGLGGPCLPQFRVHFYGFLFVLWPIN